MPIVWLPAALDDLERILEYQADEPVAGVLDQVLGAVARLAAAPFRGRPGRWPGTRVLSVAPGYTVTYRARAGNVEILAVLSDAAPSAGLRT